MKTYILLLILITVSLTINAQTIWTGAGGDTNWSTDGNWNSNVVPTTTNDVIIPTGFTVTLNVAGTPKSIEVQGNSTFNINANLTFTESSTFDANTTINWADGTINGTSSTLTNLGTINTITSAIHNFTGNTTLDNQGALNIASDGSLTLRQTTLINNPLSGTIDMQADGGIIRRQGGTGLINNEGLITKTTSTGEAQIELPINNNDGTIQVEVGTLSLNSFDKNLTDGTYNVFEEATMDWDTTINPTGTLSGTIVGDLNWNNNVNVVDGTFTAFNFSASDNFKWTTGSLVGDGTLININVLKLTTTSEHNILNSATLDNQGLLNITSSGDLTLREDSMLNNPLGGTIDLQADGGNIRRQGGTGVLNNEGLIKKTTSTGEAQIILPINNNDGTIQVEVGTLSLSSLDKNLTDGTYNVFTGATMDWDTTINPTGTLSGTINGDLNWNSNVNVLDGTFAAFNFSASDNFNWTTGSLVGDGTLININVLKLTTSTEHNILNSATLDNQGLLNITSSGDLTLRDDSMLNNPLNGTIDMQADGGNIRRQGGTGVLNNEGLIKKTTSTGEAQITLPINNNDGTIQVEVGTLSLSTLDKNLTNGIYNVFAGATMDWDTTINPSGTLSGTIDGDLNWNSTVNVPVGETAVFNFSESDNFSWASGSLSGGGKLTNMNVIKLTTSSFHAILGATILDNQGIINMTSSGGFLINQESILNNSINGTIDIQGDTANITWNQTPAGVLNNTGLIKKTTTNSVSIITTGLNNSGTIQVETGEVEISGSQPFTNEVTGIVKGIGIFDLATVGSYINNGTFAPGLSPGILTVDGDFTSSTSAKLDIEINGSIQGTDYDLLTLLGDAALNGAINVTLGFEPVINDEFIVATTSGTITECALNNTATSSFNGNQYTFDVECRNDNEVVLTLSEILGVNEFELVNTKLYPNPTSGNFTIDLSEAVSEINVSISNILGQVISNERFVNTSTLNLNIQGGSGIYFVNVNTSENNQKTFKIVKK